MDTTFDQIFKTTKDSLTLVKSPLILKELGWEASPMHWDVLDHFYLARTICECEAALNKDAKKLGFESLEYALGEQLSDCVERFVDQGLIRILTSQQKLSKVVLLRDMHRVAQSLGLEQKPTKIAQIKLLLAFSSADELCRNLCPEPYLTLTDEGKQLHRKRRSALKSASGKMCELIWKAAINDDLEHAFTLVRDLKLINDSAWFIDESILSESLKNLFFETSFNIGNDPQKAQLIISNLDQECVSIIIQLMDAPNIDDVCLAACIIHLIDIEDSWSLFPKLNLQSDLVEVIPYPSLLFSSITELLNVIQTLINENRVPEKQ